MQHSKLITAIKLSTSTRISGTINSIFDPLILISLSNLIFFYEKNNEKLEILLISSKWH